VRIAVAKVLAAAADAVLVAHCLPIQLCAHLVTAQPVQEVAWRQEKRGRKKKGGGAGDKQRGSC
jgi:hypothetical protein